MSSAARGGRAGAGTIVNVSSNATRGIYRVPYAAAKGGVTGHPLFQHIPSPVEVMRYHSLVVSPSSLPPELDVTAWSADRSPGEEIMALCHQTLPVYGVQFHPEYKSKPLNAHPLFASFVRAAYENRLQSETSMEKNGEVDLVMHERVTATSGD